MVANSNFGGGYLKNTNKKGFTLIELLAVIVILAIIALIAVPIVLNMIEDARKSAAVDSAYGYIKAVEYEIGLDELKNKNRFKDGKEDVENLDINVKGTKPTYGEIEIKNKNIIYANMCINGYMVTYENEKAKAFDRCTGSYDKTGPEIILGQVSGTTNSLTIPFEVVDNESEIKEIKCYYGIDKKYEKEGKIENNKCVITGLKNNTTYNYKIEATNAGGITSTKEDSETTRNFEGVEIKVDTADWAQSKEITIIGSTEGAELQYQINAKEEDNWIEIKDGHTFTLKENGTIYARLYDGVNASNEVDMTILNIDTTGPLCGSWSGESTIWTNENRTIKVECMDSESGCKQSSYTKTYSTTTKTSTSSITISDIVGNTTICTPPNALNIYVDKTAPTISVLPANSSVRYKSGSYAALICTDGHSGVAESKWTDEAGLVTTGKDYVLQPLISIGTLSYNGECIDNLGNSSKVNKTYNIISTTGTGVQSCSISENYSVSLCSSSGGRCLPGTTSDQLCTCHLCK